MNTKVIGTVGYRNLKVLFDRNSLQVYVHCFEVPKNKRLEYLFDNLNSYSNLDTLIVDLSNQNKRDLQKYDVIVITTRLSPNLNLPPRIKNNVNGFTDNEIDSLVNLVNKEGKGLFILSNHSNHNSTPDLTKEDKRLAQRFGIRIEDTFFSPPSTK